MSEYIVNGAEPNNTVLKSVTPNGYEHEKWLPVREEIVRCRDCAFFREKDWRCTSYQWRNCDESPDVEPDGFCAWGERRVD
ncbi:MAG: hypothetical protein IJ087_12585 [Eggerthellaceae bacterium]|nr:hypothetical protein [Eggerthellaceae bacterium]